MRLLRTNATAEAHFLLGFRTEVSEKRKNISTHLAVRYKKRKKLMNLEIEPKDRTKVELISVKNVAHHFSIVLNSFDIIDSPINRVRPSL